MKARSLFRAASDSSAARWAGPVALLAAVVALSGSPSAGAAPAAKAEPLDVLYLTDARPVVLRLHLTSNGKPLQDAWAGFADILFAKLDADKNGRLEEKELTRLRPTLALVMGLNPRGSAASAARPQPMSRDEFRDYLKKNDLGPLRLPSAMNQANAVRGRVRRGGQPTPDELDNAILKLLDANKDGKLSAAELSAGAEILAKLDADENEMIGTDELLRRPMSPYSFVQGLIDVMPQPARPGVEFLAFSRTGMDTNLAKRLLTRYGTKPPPPNIPGLPQAIPRPGGPNQQAEPVPRRLTKKDLGLGASAFAALDQDGDDELDAEELAHFGQNVGPDVEIALRFGKLKSGTKAVEIIVPPRPPMKASAGLRGAEASVDVPGVRLDLMPGPVFFLPPPMPGSQMTTRLRMQYLNRFRILDRDGNGYVDTTEANNDPVFRDLFPVLDKDGDGKVFEKELLAAVDEAEDLDEAATNGVVTIELTEVGHGLFGLIDADGDGRFSVRELRAMATLVERFDANKDGLLAPNEIPRRFEAKFSQGFGAGQAPYGVLAVPVPAANGPPRAQAGPVWFQKMDRNRDGDVSRREFLGTEEDFRKLDTDGDGLISVQEAEAAGKKE
ncbi:hypothetical protein [Fimbriiglobus ruber]|uniref:EF-hand domain-containing protein n=1 Tax=Fimbriiglobus ruber TaxID=1908690 RepID=A0A225DJW7_9BACT|nr:hypothetical protein [Fimbriiglobus ruber]OWK41760.1 hypothetical protein FRUB_03838 [Fimbriiglobus ruber]